MATTTNISTTYAGEKAAGYISASLLSGETIAQNAITVKPNVKFKEVLKTVSTDGLLKNATCDFDPTSTITLAERILQPEFFQVNLQLCKSDFQSDWDAASMGYSAFDSLPPSFADFILGHVAAKVAQKTEQNIWGGVNANPGEFDGFTTLMSADASVNDVVTSETTFSSATIIAELGKLVSTIPTTVYGKEDVVIYIPTIAFQAYVRALGGFATGGLGANGVDSKGSLWYSQGQSLSFEGIRVFHAPGMPADHMVAAQASNLFFGTGLLSDLNEVKLLDMADLDGSQNARVIMRAAAGVQYAISEDVALYTLA